MEKQYKRQFKESFNIISGKVHDGLAEDLEATISMYIDTKGDPARGSFEAGCKLGEVLFDMIRSLKEDNPYFVVSAFKKGVREKL